jgi:hypothetical protein
MQQQQHKHRIMAYNTILGMNEIYDALDEI